MKADEAPEKIYLVRTTRIIDEWRKKPSQYGYNIEYTRTDAFIDKACAFIRERFYFGDNSWYTDGEVTLKDEVIEEFQNHMKGNKV